MKSAVIVTALLAVSASAAERARFVMGTTCTIASADAAQIEQAFAEAARIESMLSTWTDGSELARVNRGEMQPSDELRALLAHAEQWSRETGGAFDPHVKALIDIWRTRDDGAIPDASAIANARKQTAIEEGAFGKGYALDRMLPLLRGDALIDFGGQLAVRGTTRVAIADPSHRDRPALELTLSNASLSTSSGSEKTFVVGGRRFSHLLDPRTGEALPPRGSVSVIHERALDADILSTALYVMGDADGLRWADAHGIAAIFIDSANHVRLSAPARSRDVRIVDRKFSLKD